MIQFILIWLIKQNNIVSSAFVWWKEIYHGARILLNFPTKRPPRPRMRWVCAKQRRVPITKSIRRPEKNFVKIGVEKICTSIVLYRCLFPGGTGGSSRPSCDGSLEGGREGGAGAYNTPWGEVLEPTGTPGPQQVDNAGFSQHPSLVPGWNLPRRSSDIPQRYPPGSHGGIP